MLREMLPETVLGFRFKNFIILDLNFTRYCIPGVYMIEVEIIQ